MRAVPASSRFWISRASARWWLAITSDKVGSYLGYTDRDGDIVATAARHPDPT